MDGVIVSWVGNIAAALATISLVPQVVKTWRTRSAKDLSAAWFLVALLSIMLWITYGVILPTWAVVEANIFTAILVGMLLFFKVRYG